MEVLPTTSETLIARVKDPADATAWTDFVAIYRPVIYRMARRRAMQDADAHDVAQKVLLAVSQAIANWEPGKDRPPFRAWLLVLSRNAIINALSRRRPDAGSGSTQTLELLHEQVDNDPQTTAELALEARRETLRWATEQVRGEFSEAIWRMFWETAVLGRTPADVAGELGRTPGAVYMARFRVMQRLKEKVLEGTMECQSENLTQRHRGTERT
jgi:RNA polymerase sigma-70 factor (ECF subfamily)